MLHLRLQYQGAGSAAGLGQFGMTQFANQGAFAGEGGDNFGGATFDGVVPANDFGPITPQFTG
jgi:hypothetical protein